MTSEAAVTEKDLADTAARLPKKLVAKLLTFCLAHDDIWSDDAPLALELINETLGEANLHYFLNEDDGLVRIQIRSNDTDVLKGETLTLDAFLAELWRSTDGSKHDKTHAATLAKWAKVFARKAKP